MPFPHFIFPLAKFDNMVYGGFMPESTLDILRQIMAAGDWPAALSLATKFPRLGEHKAAITRAHGAIMNPGFYREIGHNPESLIASGIAAFNGLYQESV